MYRLYVCGGVRVFEQPTSAAQVIQLVELVRDEVKAAVPLCWGRYCNIRILKIFIGDRKHISIGIMTVLEVYIVGG